MHSSQHPHAHTYIHLTPDIMFWFINLLVGFHAVHQRDWGWRIKEFFGCALLLDSSLVGRKCAPGNQAVAAGRHARMWCLGYNPFSNTSSSPSVSSTLLVCLSVSRAHFFNERHRWRNILTGLPHRSFSFLSFFPQRKRDWMFRYFGECLSFVVAASLLYVCFHSP